MYYKTDDLCHYLLECVMPIFIVESYRDGKPIEVVGAFSTRELANAFIIEHMRFDTPIYYRISSTFLNTESLNNDE